MKANNYYKIKAKTPSGLGYMSLPFSLQSSAFSLPSVSLQSSVFFQKFVFPILLIILSSFVHPLWSQAAVRIVEDPSVTRIMDQYLRNNRAITHISGWRITVITTTDRRLMEQNQTRFKGEFPGMKVKWEYNEPYYYLKAGAFVSRADAAYQLEQVKKKFPSAFLSVDRISYEEF